MIFKRRATRVLEPDSDNKERSICGQTLLVVFQERQVLCK